MGKPFGKHKNCLEMGFSQGNIIQCQQWQYSISINIATFSSPFTGCWYSTEDKFSRIVSPANGRCSVVQAWPAWSHVSQARYFWRWAWLGFGSWFQAYWLGSAISFKLIWTEFMRKWLEPLKLLFLKLSLAWSSKVAEKQVHPHCWHQVVFLLEKPIFRQVLWFPNSFS